MEHATLEPRGAPCDNLRLPAFGQRTSGQVRVASTPGQCPRLSLTRSAIEMKLVPLGENVIVKRTESEETSPGGIVLPETVREKPQTGRVLSVGDGRRLADGTRARSQVNEGDRILFKSWAGTEVLVDGEKLLIMDEDDILAVVI
jgi:chaperonin GroES